MMLTEMKDDELLKLVALDLNAAMKEGEAMSFYGWRPYVRVAERRRQAAAKLSQAEEEGPARLAGRRSRAARSRDSFWGKAWCDNLERYSDYANRLPRGRTYVRNGSVVDLQIAPGEVTRAGQRLATLQDQDRRSRRLPKARWKAICRRLRGRRSTRWSSCCRGASPRASWTASAAEGDGLFPAPDEIKLSCSCPDWAAMCKHVAAVLYGVGARLDAEPELLFTLRGVDPAELIARPWQPTSR